MTKRIDELVQTICGTAGHPLAPFLYRWCSESRPFLAFAETHAAKIRKKARLALVEDELSDLLAELAVAAFLARDRRFSVLYEPPRPASLRSPDFHVIYKTHISLYVEVTRLRLQNATNDDNQGAVLKLARVICEKIGQCQSGAMNTLAVVIPPNLENADLAPAAIRMLDNYPQRQTTLPAVDLRPEAVRAFLSDRRRISAIALCAFTPTWQPLRVDLWLNPQAKHPLHPDITRYISQSQAEGK